MRENPSRGGGTSGMRDSPIPRKVLPPTVQRSLEPSLGHETSLQPTRLEESSPSSARVEEMNRERARASVDGLSWIIVFVV